MVCLHCPIPIPRPTPIPTPMQIQKCYTGTDSDGDSYAKSQCKLVKFYLIGTYIGAKMGTVAIGIGIGTYIGIGIGSLETLLHIILIAIFIGIGIGIGIGIRFGQWKHSMIRQNRINLKLCKLVLSSDYQSSCHLKADYFCVERRIY